MEKKKKKLKRKGRQAFPKINKTQNYTHTPIIQNHFPGAKSPLNYEDSCIRYQQHSSITKKTSRRASVPSYSLSYKWQLVWQKLLCPADNNSRKKKKSGTHWNFFPSYAPSKKIQWKLTVISEKTFRTSVFKHFAAQSESRYSEIHLNMLKQSQTASYHVWNVIKVKEVLEEPQSFPAKLGESNSSKQVSPVSSTAQVTQMIQHRKLLLKV